MVHIKWFKKIIHLHENNDNIFKLFLWICPRNYFAKPNFGSKQPRVLCFLFHPFEILYKKCKKSRQKKKPWKFVTWEKRKVKGNDKSNINESNNNNNNNNAKSWAMIEINGFLNAQRHCSRPYPALNPLAAVGVQGKQGELTRCRQIVAFG